MLTNAPALKSLIIRERNDVARILEFLFHIRGSLRKLILQHCSLGDDSTGLLTKIVALSPDLEVLSLAGCRPLTSDGYCLIPRLKNLSELKLSYSEVDCMYVTLLETRIYIREACKRTPLEIHCLYIGKKEIYCSFKSYCIISILLYTKWHLFYYFITFGSSNTFSIKSVLKFKYPPC